MRDPELVFKAQIAASALEQAWQHWREIHGLQADPMPVISSYVGYSLEEPWGQPRVVFGLAAADAEQLAALLERHDCIGPVPAMAAAQPGRSDILAGAGAIAGRSLPVPPQAPSLHAEPKISDDGMYRTAGIRPGVGQADNEDGPVYRQLAAALLAPRGAPAVVQTRETEAAERDPTVEEPAIEDSAVQESAVQESAVHEPVAEEPVAEEPVDQEPAVEEATGLAAGETGEAAADQDNADSPSPTNGTGTDGDGDGRGGQAADIGAGKTDSQTSSKSPNSRTGDSGGLNRGPGKGNSRDVGQRKAVSRRAGAGRGSHSRSAASRAGVESGDEAADGPAPDAGRQNLAAPPASAAPDVPADGDADQENADNDAATQTAHRPGPLALAASAARIAAEARIRAARQKTSPSAVERPRAGVTAEVSDPSTLRAGDGANVPAADASAAGADQASATSGDSPEIAGPDSGDMATALGGPGFATEGDNESELVRFWPWSQRAADAEGDPEPGGTVAEPQEYPQAGYAWRNRIARGYSIPRLSRTKRPGAVSGP